MTFTNETRKKDETCSEYFDKLVAALKLGLNVSVLSEDHQNICLEKFLSSIHPTLRGMLEIREPEVTFHDVLYIAQRIELAQNIPRIKPAVVNNVNKKASNTGGNNANQNLICAGCRGQGHSVEQCWGNRNGKNFKPELFHAGHNGYQNKALN